MKRNRRRCSLLRTLACVAGVTALMSAPVCAHSQEAAEPAAAENKTEYSSQLLPLNCEEGEQLLPVTIDPGKGTVVVDGSGEEAPLREAYGLSVQEAGELTEGSVQERREAILEYLLQEPCIVHEQEDGCLRAAYPFSMKLLFVLVKEGKLKDDFGAVKVLYDKEGGKYALQYESQEDAANAYAQLMEQYGKKKVLIDLPVAPAELKYDEKANNQTYSSFTTAKSLSWGTDVMYLDRLRDWAEAHPAQGTLSVAVVDTGIRVDETKETIINGYGIDAGRVLKSSCQSITSSVYDYTALHDYSDSNWQPKTCAYADLRGHGTHVMSTVLDGTPSQVKVFAIRNSCNRPYKYNETVYALGDVDGMVKSVARAGELKAKVVNMSQGINCYDYETGKKKGYSGKGIPKMEDIADATFWYYNNEIARMAGLYDLCVVTAAGNDGKDSGETMHFPGMNSGVIEVSNLTYKDGFTLNSSSNFGENVSFCAPGTTIVGAGYDWENHKACYVSKSGTSMAAPHISAALAILRLYYPELSNMETAELLRAFCTDLGDKGRDDKYGYGFPQFRDKSVTFVYNDSATEDVTVTLPRGMQVSKPENPVRDRYSFGGWCTDKAATQQYDFKQPVRGNLTLYARWRKILKVVTFDYNGHGGTSLTLRLPIGTCVTPPADPQEDGWIFRGWYSDTEQTHPFDFNTPITVSSTLYAKWEQEESEQAANPLSVKGKTATVKYSKLKKKTQTLPVTKVITFLRKGKGEMSYVKKSGDKKIAIDQKTGTVTVKKGLKKGTYKVKATAAASGNESYLPSGEKKVTFKIKVK